MSPTHMDEAERRELLGALSQIASDADQSRDSVRSFLPLHRHQQALSHDTLLVRGPRGAGKTALFHFIEQMNDRQEQLDRLFPRADIKKCRWIIGFSETSTHHPMPDVLDAFAETAEQETLRLFWLTHLACTLERELQLHTISDAVFALWRDHRNEPARWVAAAKGELGALASWLDECERGFTREQRFVVVQYDHLDRIGVTNRPLQERFAGALLALWMSLSHRYRWLRCKIFIRDDLFEASQNAFSDASKMASRSVSLDWDVPSLYRLLVRQVANASDDLAGWVQRSGFKIELERDVDLGWLPPDAMPERGNNSIKHFADHLAGEQMGRGPKKGMTYRWIPNHLQDAHGRVFPRGVIDLIGGAARVALEKGPQAQYDRLLRPEHLVDALEATSRRRAMELAEEHKVVQRLENLRGYQVLLDRRETERQLSRAPDHGDDFGDDGREVCDELIRLGVLKVRMDGRIDVPDIYRHGYGIYRKGGAKRAR